MEVKIKAIHFDITDKLVAFINKSGQTRTPIRGYHRGRSHSQSGQTGNINEQGGRYQTDSATVSRPVRVKSGRHF